MGADSDSQGAGNKTILVVDDEPMVLGLLRNMLVREGYVVLEASEAAEAIELSSVGSRPIDLLLTDVVMPGMNGYQLADRLKDQRPELKVLANA